MNRRELPDEASALVHRLADEAFDLWPTDPDRARELSEQAWEAIPEPKHQWIRVAADLCRWSALGEVNAANLEAAATWLERHRQMADVDDRSEQAGYWAL